MPKTTVADFAHDQSIDQITSDSDNDVQQNEAEIKKHPQVFSSTYIQVVFLIQNFFSLAVLL